MPIVPIEEINLLHSNVCQAVSEPKRVQILYALSDQPMSVNNLAQVLHTPQPTISRHLAVLRLRSLVLTDRAGVSVVYRLADPRIIVALDLMRQILHDVLEHQSGMINQRDE
jgi:DNA-binding transcriptional ArsR family regulator